MPPLSGFLRTPLTDLTGTILTHQDFGRCAEFEMQAANCLEAYGGVTGTQKCRDILEDYLECFRNCKQMKRFSEMRKERYRQYRKGERSKNQLFAQGPRLDSFE